jgi:hypothetical protein
MMRRAMLTAALFVLVATTDALALPTVGTAAPIFEVFDGDDHGVKLAAFRGKPTLVVFEDKDAASQNELFKTRLSLTIVAKGIAKKMSTMPIADVAGYDYWPARGFVKDAIASAATKSGTTIYADWKGDARKKLAAPAGKSTLVLLDAKGTVVWASSGALDKDAQDRLLARIVELASA